jgi:hypothetical protein
MASDLFVYEIVLLGLLLLCIMLHHAWPSQRLAGDQRTSKPAKLTRKPHCAACEQTVQEPAVLPPLAPPPPITSNRGRPRQVDTSQQFCSSNGHPNGGPWRQLYCSQCEGYFLETHGTIFYGKRVAVELIVRVLACLAEGLGIRGTARVFEVDPNTVLA